MPEVTFFPRNNNDKANSYSLYCRVYINKNQSEFSTKEKINPSEWNQNSQIYNGQTDEKTNYINLLCERIKYKIKTIALLYEDQDLNAQKVIQTYHTPIVKEAPVTIYKVIDKFIEWEIIEEVLDNKTIAIHERFLKHLKEYFVNKKTYVSDFNEVEAQKFIEWFKLSRGTRNKTAANRHVSFYRNAMQWGVKNGVIKAHCLLYFEGERDKIKKPVPIVENELPDLIIFDFKSPMLSKVRDLFLFQVATGLSYSDIWGDFSIENTSEGKVIKGKRSKG